MRLNKRGRRVRAAIVTALVIALIYALTALIWWTGAGFCLGTMSGCVGI
jgi:ABC-type dipeptide/oligopeptide/nickel transport system permease subunit